MKFTCTKENLLYALDLVSSLAGKHVSLPILQNVLIVAEESKIDFITTNLEMSVKATVRGKVEQTGNFTVPAKTISDYVRLINDEKIDLSLEENELLVKSQNASTKIKGSSAEEFPVIPEIEESNLFLLSAENFKDYLTKTAVAVAKNEIRPELSGVYFGFNTERHKGLILAATDSYRLSEAKINLEQGENKIECIVPGRTAFEMIRLISLALNNSEEKQIRLAVGENQVSIRFDSFEMVSRLVDGKYPDYSQIIPANFKTSAAIPVDLLIKNIKAASIFTTTGINAVSFDLNVSNKTVGVSSTSTQTGEHSSEMDVDVSGEENSILLNHRYVLDGLQQMSGEIYFGINGHDAPCVFKPKNNNSYLYIVMPIRQ